LDNNKTNPAPSEKTADQKKTRKKRANKNAEPKKPMKSSTRVLLILLLILLLALSLCACGGSGSGVIGGADGPTKVVVDGKDDTEQAAVSGATVASGGAAPDAGAPAAEATSYYFRSNKLLQQHYEKHGIEMGFTSAEEYEAAASAVINDPAALYKTEAEDGDGVYYLEDSNEFVVLSKDGYIRTYFLPSSGKKYFDRQ
jgi:hypothetical protein